MDENKELSYDLLSLKERQKLIEALTEGQGREPTEEEKVALISWAIQSRLNQEFLSLVNKDILKITMDEENGYLMPNFSPTKIGEEVNQVLKERNKNLEAEGDEILREMTKGLKDPDDKA